MALVYLERVCSDLRSPLYGARHGLRQDAPVATGGGAGAAHLSHRLLLAGLIVATKMAHDRPLKNATWAQHSGGLMFAPRDINHIETHMLHLLRYQLTVRENELLTVAAALLPSRPPHASMPDRVSFGPVGVSGMHLDSNSDMDMDTDTDTDSELDSGSHSVTVTAALSPSTPSIGNTRSGDTTASPDLGTSAVATPICLATEGLVGSIPKRISSGEWIARLRWLEMEHAERGEPVHTSPRPSPESSTESSLSPSPTRRDKHCVMRHHYRWSEPPLARVAMYSAPANARPISFSTWPTATAISVAAAVSPCPSPGLGLSGCTATGAGGGRSPTYRRLLSHHLHDLRGRASALRWRTKRKIRSMIN